VRRLAFLAVVALCLSITSGLLTTLASAATPPPERTVLVIEPDAGPPVDLPVLPLELPRLDLFLVTGPVDGAVSDAVAPDEQVFTAAADVFFAFGQAELSERARTELDRVATLISAAGLRAVEVVGHTDAVGSDADNLDLSGRRAEAVRAVLAERLPGATLTARGVGEAEPVAPEQVNGADNPDGRAANRRVEIRAVR
jgi:outer membrane protein OmpA-like peptidoglycan-associated protein